MILPPITALVWRSFMFASPAPIKSCIIGRVSCGNVRFKELQANLLPGVTIVPAMVIAIEKAQTAGIRQKRQWVVVPPLRRERKEARRDERGAGLPVIRWVIIFRCI